jgi:hypothetical protein
MCTPPLICLEVSYHVRLGTALLEAEILLSCHDLKECLIFGVKPICYPDFGFRELLLGVHDINPNAEL